MKNNIRVLRKELRLRQEDVAKMVGVTRQTIIAIENGRYNPTLELAIKLAILFDTPVEEIFHLEE
ncbi:MAG: helix-turn-helix transcriptional regulator [Clostridiales bacterium]|nr:helix-turn-helix transcriptional regulator [Clostridiales bacterium]